MIQFMALPENPALSSRSKVYFVFSNFHWSGYSLHEVVFGYYQLLIAVLGVSAFIRGGHNGAALLRKRLRYLKKFQHRLILKIFLNN